jgi:predicted nucleic acid-binding protein
VILVVDASVVVKWFVEEERSAHARALLDGPHRFLAPEILTGEVLNAAWKKLRRGEIAAGQYEEIVLNIGLPLIERRSLLPLAPRAAALARELDHPVYDCFYLALTEAERAPLVTDDRRLLARIAATPLVSQVTPLESFPNPPTAEA